MGKLKRQRTLDGFLSGASASSSPCALPVNASGRQLHGGEEQQQQQRVVCPVCQANVLLASINEHLDTCCPPISPAPASNTSLTEIELDDSTSAIDRIVGQEDAQVTQLPATDSDEHASRKARQASTSQPTQVSSLVNPKLGYPRSNPWRHVPTTAVGSPHHVKGHRLLMDFITPKEEQCIIEYLDADRSNPWRSSSWNGQHQRKAYGVVVSLTKRTVDAPLRQIPHVLQPIMARFRELPGLESFYPNEVNANEYMRSRGDWLAPHVDDRQLSGTVLATLATVGDVIMTCSSEKRVPNMK
eukprot:jgi/Chlat1/5962/Chrsp4S06185